mmetsp:Transcript_86841/g.218615  ORF Transcript_86841/g.218615 Transcript_86841/m.218615 type:complete len:397 (+) Transcript_86841:37-1227(+)
MAMVFALPSVMSAGPHALFVEALAEVAKEGPSFDAKAIAARRTALTALGCAAREGDVMALQVLSAGAVDWHPQVQQAAVKALDDVVRQGGRRAVYARLQAVEAVVSAARVGNKEALAALTTGLIDTHVSVREAALAALARIAIEGDSAAGPIVAARVAAVTALKAVALKGETRAVAVLTACMQDWHSAVSRAGLDATIALALGGDVGVETSAAIISGRCSAVRALAPIARRGDTLAVKALVACAMVSTKCAANETLRALAVESLAHVASDGESAAGNAVAARVAAVTGLSAAVSLAVAAGYHVTADRAMTVLMECSAEWHVSVRAAAIKALVEVATCGTSNHGSLSPEAEVAFARIRWAAVAALVAAAKHGDKDALAALTALEVAGRESTGALCGA